jgi:hypothetical protein
MEAGKVARAINEKRFSEAEEMIESNTPYFIASMHIATAIRALKEEGEL